MLKNFNKIGIFGAYDIRGRYPKDKQILVEKKKRNLALVKIDVDCAFISL